MKIWTSCVQQGSSNFVHKVEKHIKKYQLFPFPNNTGKEVALIDRSPAGTVVKTSVSHARGLRFKSRYGQFFFRILPLPIFSQDFFIYFNLYHLRFFMLLTLNSGTEKYWISIYVLTLLSKNPDQPNPLGTFSGCHTHTCNSGTEQRTSQKIYFTTRKTNTVNQMLCRNCISYFLLFNNFFIIFFLTWKEKWYELLGTALSWIRHFLPRGERYFHPIEFFFTTKWSNQKLFESTSKREVIRGVQGRIQEISKGGLSSRGLLVLL